jgi:hypothetical protein
VYSDFGYNVEEGLLRWLLLAEADAIEFSMTKYTVLLTNEILVSTGLSTGLHAVTQYMGADSRPTRS